MKKFLCIFLSALLICALFIIPASAAEASLSYTFHRGEDLSLDSLSDINALPIGSLPASYDGSAGGQGNNFFFVLSLPSFVSINSLDVAITGDPASNFLSLYDSEGVLITTLNVRRVNSIDLSSYDNISSLVYKMGIASGSSISAITFDLDYESPSVWNGISDFIGGLFGAVGSILGGALNNSLLLMFLILIPLSGIVRDILYYNFLNKRKKSNSINRYRAKRGNYGRDSYKEV